VCVCVGSDKILSHTHTHTHGLILFEEKVVGRERKRERGISLHKKWIIRLLVPVMLSQRIREVMIRPNGLNSDSNSCCVRFFGNPLTYKLAPLIASLLGLAYETWKTTSHSINPRLLTLTSILLLLTSIRSALCFSMQIYHKHPHRLLISLFTRRERDDRKILV